MADAAVFADELSNVRRELSFHIELLPVPGVRLISDGNDLRFKLQNIIDCLALETVYFGADQAQKAAVAVVAAHLIMAGVVLRYHLDSYIITIRPIIILILC